MLMGRPHFAHIVKHESHDMSQAVSVTTANFRQEVIEASHHQPVLVDFWAPWCGPCRMLGPVLDQLAASTPGIKVVKLNTDEEPEVAGAYAIRSIPAVKLFKNGEVVDEFVGAQPLGAVKSFVAAHLPKQSDPRLEDASRLIMAGDTSGAEKILDALPPVMQSEPDVKSLRAKVYFARIALSPDETDSIQSARVAAARYLLKDDWRAGIESLFTAAERNRRYATGAGRDDLLKAFDLNTADELALASARRRLAALLH